jgi:cbb3-type cytochrome c oxidase subunit III
MKTILRCALVAVGMGLAFATVAAAAPDQPDGAALFKQKCSMCHGADGKGFAALKTPDFTDPKWQASKTDQEIASTIKNGKQGTMMQAFGNQLKDDDIDALVKQIRSFRKK